jgi:hypothetical protein
MPEIAAVFVERDELGRVIMESHRVFTVLVSREVEGRVDIATLRSALQRIGKIVEGSGSGFSGKDCAAIFDELSSMLI